MPASEIGLQAPFHESEAARREQHILFERANKKEMTLLAVYFSSVVLISDLLNVRLGVELLTLTVCIAAGAVSRQFRRFLRDWWFFLVGLLLWNLSGPIAARSPFPAHLDFMLQLDRLLFLGHDPAILVQQRLMTTGHLHVLDWLAAASYNAHLPEPYIAGYFLWRLNRLVYLQFAAAALALLVFGFVTFILFPAVPPWMAYVRFHRVPTIVNGFGLVLHQHPLPFHGSPLFHFFKWRGDSVAAFPSEHAALPFLELLAFSRIAGPLLLAVLAVWTAWVLFVIVYLGEHWVTDALTGWLYAVVIFAAVRRLTAGSQAET